MLKGLKVAGKYVVGAGLMSTFFMAVVGTAAIDIVFFAFLIKKSKESGFGSFLTGYLWGTMFSGNRHHHIHSTNYGVLLLASPFLTGIAIGLSFLLGVPQVGILLGVGWGVSLGIVGVGTGIVKLADMGLALFDRPKPYSVHDYPTEYSHNYYGTYTHIHRETQQVHRHQATQHQEAPPEYVYSSYQYTQPSAPEYPGTLFHYDDKQRTAIPVATAYPVSELY